MQLTQYKHKKFWFLIALYIVVFCNISIAQTNTIKALNLHLKAFLNSSEFISITNHKAIDSITIDSIVYKKNTTQINIYISKNLSHNPIRENTVLAIQNKVSNYLSQKVDVAIYCNNKRLSEYIPNYFRSNKGNWDFNRINSTSQIRSKPLVKNLSDPIADSLNLNNTNIALWNSHGWYYEESLHRWEWQRARLFNTVEDLLPTTYILHYLLPMLENAGASVFLPRERYWRNKEVIVDNDFSTGSSTFKSNKKEKSTISGYKYKEILHANENPFAEGSAIQYLNSKENTSFACWIPNIPESGNYPVYVSYSSDIKNSANAVYIITHSGGETTYKVNQKISGNTWVYLGTFHFKQGYNPKLAKVELQSHTSNKNEFLIADAVRFGNGMGTISRNGLTSRRPRYQEAARYFLQYHGFPDSIVWNQNLNNDYTDDRHARTAWVNYLIGAPSGPKKMPNAKGMGIDIDLTLAFHTDAGITNSDSVIGTLGIYSTQVDTAVYPNGQSKMVSRDLTDLIQSEIVNDIRHKYDSNWVRRAMWDKAYTEAARPNTPTMILELLSHQNFMDVRFSKEPAFQFDVSRAIYKGILKFLYTNKGIDYKVQPMPITHFQASLTQKGDINLKWKKQTDLFEPSAEPDYFIVYTKKNDSGFDNGTIAYNNNFTLKKPKKNTIYSFKVCAVNKGGKSFPSEQLSVCSTKKSEGTVVIINAFDRLGGSAYFNDSLHAGFQTQQDAGVPYKYDIHTTGDQYNFTKTAPWVDDDSPGFGASYADLEDKIIPGNTFNFSYIHGRAIRNAGFSFISVSDEAIELGSFKLNDYQIIDILAGEEKGCYFPKSNKVNNQIYTPELINVLESFTANGGNILISGAHIGSELLLNKQNKKLSKLFQFNGLTSNACRTGKFYSINKKINSQISEYTFNSKYHKFIYTVEGADAIIPVDANATTLFRYAENNMSAGIIYEGKYKVIAVGFPFETIIDENERNILMTNFLNILNDTNE